MKRQLRICLSLSALFVFAFNAQAQQITITRSDFGDIGDFAVNAYDTVYAGLTTGNAGSNETWDLDTVQNHYMDTIYFKNPAATPYASSFPSANIATFNSLDSSYFFLNANSNSVSAVGSVLANPVTGTPAILPFNPSVTQITFPSNLGTAFNVSNATGQTTVYYHDTYAGTTFDSIRGTTIINRASIIDGWGTTHTPVGSFNTLRQKINETTSISVEIYAVSPAFGWIPVPLGGTDTTIYYFYLGNGQNWPIAEIQTNNSGTITEAKYLANAANSVPELTASGNEDLVIYPNPSAGEFNVTKLNRKASVLKIFDVRGKETGIITIDNSFTNFSMSSYPDGIYLFQVLDKTGVMISTGKLAVQK